MAGQEPAGPDGGSPDTGERFAVLGLGSILVGDDGAGLAATAELVRRYELPASVTIYDGGVLGLHLLGLLEGVEHLLVLDAVTAGRPPGDLVRLDGADVHATFAAKFSVHELGFAELLAAAAFRGRSPRHLVVWGVEPQDVSPGLGLSAPIGEAVGALADAAAGELRSWGLDVPPREHPGEALPYPEEVLGLTAEPASMGSDSLRSPRA